MQYPSFDLISTTPEVNTEHFFILVSVEEVMEWNCHPLIRLTKVVLISGTSKLNVPEVEYTSSLGDDSLVMVQEDVSTPS